MSALPTIGLVFIVIASLTVLLPSFIKSRLKEREDVSIDRFSNRQSVVHERRQYKTQPTHQNSSRQSSSQQNSTSQNSTRQALFAPTSRPPRPVYDFEVREAAYKKQPEFSATVTQLPRAQTGLNKTFSGAFDSLMKDVAKLDQEAADVTNSTGSYSYRSPGEEIRRRAYGR